VRAVRERLHHGDFLEVETPMLQTVHGGANARPFITHINAYDMRMYLRIAPELYLKRLCVAGVERVFELNRNFRNEGIDATHNPEFTMLEAYQAYADYGTMRQLMRELVQYAAEAAYGAQVVRRPGPDGKVVEHDISGDWPVIPVHEAVSAALGEQIDAGTPVEVLRRLCGKAGIQVDSRADVLHRLSDRGFAADQAAPGRSAAGRAVGSDRVRLGGRHGVYRADRPDRAAPQAGGAVAAGGERGCRGDGA
jgi:lysyl-tRNA synthetase class 2